MPQLIPYHLTFPGGIHLGNRGINLEEAGVHVPADTLFSALVVTWRLLGHDPGDFVAPFTQGDPPFLLTSAFPYAGRVRFYPMPVDPGRLFTPQAWKGVREAGKAFKRVRYLSEGLLAQALAGVPLDAWLPQEGNSSSGVLLQEGVLWLQADEIGKLPAPMQREKSRPRSPGGLRHQLAWKEARVPRVTVDRISSASNIFHVGRVRFAPDCGLWFGIRWRDEARPVAATGLSYREAVDRCLAVLQDSGLGGERTVGYGRFQAQAHDPVTLADPRPGQAAWLLSRYLPRDGGEVQAGLLHPDAAYELTTLRGWTAALDHPDQRRKSLTLVAEGSLVGWPGQQEVMGRLADLRPTYQNPAGDLPHPVYRYGLALAVGLAPQEVQHG